jgi:hypothetical protein
MDVFDPVELLFDGLPEDRIIDVAQDEHALGDLPERPVGAIKRVPL